MSDRSPADNPDDVRAPSPQLIRSADLIGTGLFAVSALAAVALDGAAVTIFTVLSVVLFVAGSLFMLIAFAWGVDRSRTEEVSVAGLFLLMGSAPRSAQRLLMGLVLAQTVIAVTTAAIRPFTGLAFGILVPMYGLGLAGVHGARHGRFTPRNQLDHKRPEHARRAQGEDNG